MIFKGKYCDVDDFWMIENLGRLTTDSCVIAVIKRGIK